MDVTIFAWIFVIVFFLLYSAVQAQRCCKNIQKSITNREAATDATTEATTNANQIFTVENSSRQQDMTGNLHSRNFIVSVYDNGMKKDDGLPTYEEAIAIDTNNNNNLVINKIESIEPPSTQMSATSPSPSPTSVVIHIQAQVPSPQD